MVYAPKNLFCKVAVFYYYFFSENKKNIKFEKKVEKSGGKWGKLCNFERKL
jgi:hypothetical protein